MHHDPRKRIWVDIIERPNASNERVNYPEGVTEGKGSSLWEIPAGTREAKLSRVLTLPEPITHISVDAISRNQSEVEVNLMIEAGRTVKGAKDFLLYSSSNRRLLMPLGGPVRDNIRLSLRVRDSKLPTRIVLDNLRGFRLS
jgi:hypothetical protein